jgi:2-iminobutanoate/2-iminopropanoate deaminase
LVVKKEEADMPKQEIHTDQAPAPGGAYSQALRAGDFIFTAGTVPLDPVTRQVVGATIEEQTTQVLENLKAILAQAGATLDDVVKATVHLSDIGNFAGFNAVYQRYFAEPKPARTTVGSQLHGFLVEIDLVAYVGD